MDGAESRAGDSSPESPAAGNLAVVTIHGIGPYSAGSAITHLGGSDSGKGWLRSAQRIDFNWYQVVETEADEGETLSQLSRALVETASTQGDERFHPLGPLLSSTGAALNVWFKFLWLWPVLLGVVLAPFLAVYVRMGSVPAWFDRILGQVPDLWLSHAYWTGIALLVLIGCAALLTILRNPAPSMALLRRTVLLTLHPAFCLLLRLGSMDAAGAVRVGLKYTVGYGLIVLLVHSCSPDAGRQWAGLTPLNMFLAAALLVAAVAIMTLLARWLEVPLKLARDIFNYIGDKAQRSSIQAALNEQLAGVRDGARVFVIGHSLGSVIALDSLCHSPHWQRFGSVVLVTAGSPIRRMFQRFFPGLFFPRDMSAVFGYLSERLELSAWVNVYRAGFVHGDPIGQGLFVGANQGIDVPVKQRQRKLFAAHTGYWEDEEMLVHRPVREALAAATAAPTMPIPESASGAWKPPVDASERLQDAAHRASTSLLTLSVTAGLILSIAGFYVVVGERRAAANDFLSRATTEGVRAPATVSHRTATWGYGQNLDFPVEIYEFEFADQSGERRTVKFVEVEGSPFEHGYYFDSRAFRERFYGDGDDGPQSVEILYVPSVTDKLTFADAEFAPQARSFPALSVLYLGFGPVWLVTALILSMVHSLARALIGVIAPAGARGTLRTAPDENSYRDHR